MSTTKSPSKTKDVQLPLYRVKTIMKSSPDVENIGQDSLYVVGKATELFIQKLAKEAVRRCGDKDVQYNDLADLIQSTDNLSFLREILPRKITVGQFNEYMEQKRLNHDYDYNDEEDEDDDFEESE